MLLRDAITTENCPTVSSLQIDNYFALGAVHLICSIGTSRFSYPLVLFGFSTAFTVVGYVVVALLPENPSPCPRDTLSGQPCNMQFAENAYRGFSQLWERK